MTIGDRFKVLRTKLGLNQSELAREIGANPSIISDIERGDKEPSKKIISALILRYKVNSNWLLTEYGDVFVQDQVSEKSRLEQELDEIIAAHPQFAALEERLARIEKRLDREYAADDYPADYLGAAAEPVSLYTADPEPEYGGEAESKAERPVQIPYVEDIAAGPPIAQSEDQTGLVSVPARLIHKGSRYYAATVRGASMAEADIRDGDRVLIRHTDAPADGAIQVVRHQGKSTLKRLKEVEGGGWEMRYEDGSGKAVLLNSRDYQIQGEFVAVLP
ncbi:MAG: helix-turn-helix domain-containing protein [Treponema sp.]|jgi:SOS-response transcriptional repressor LexA|nr:helix-turn-helix domain-containing protein [Treponema sp.]